jgi:hypothetical protein
MDLAYRLGKLWLVGAVSWIALPLGGCRDDDSGSGTATDGDTEFDPSDPAERDLEALVEATCLQVDQCNCGSVVFGDETCTTARTRLWRDRLAYGRANDLTYAPDCVTAQMQSVARAGCSYGGDEDLHVCDDFCAVFVGDRAEGDACESFDSVVGNCAQGLTCHRGACTRPCSVLTGLVEGDRCSSDLTGQFDDCAHGLYCNFQTQTCLRSPGLGEFCDSTCGEDLVCDWQSSSCQTGVGEGESCWDAQCEPGLYCRWRESDQQQVCIRPADEGEPCPDWQCALGLVCDQICREPPGRGEPCASGVCATGLYCEWNLGICVPPPDGIGQPCPQGVCAWGLWCDQSQDPEGECQETVPLASPCTGHSQCESLYCPKGYCLPRPELGEDCSETLACASGLVCNGSTCQLAKARAPAVCIYAGW